MLLQAQNIDKYFRVPVEFQALKKVNFAVDKGEFVAITGASGSGKSTLLYILATLDTDYEGKLYFEGTELSNKSKSQLADFRNKNLGFIFQFHYLLPEFTVLENISIPARKSGIYSEAEIKKRAMELLELLDVASQADKRANRLSGGQQQRVAIARALVNGPKLIIADEPTGNLDSKNAAAVMQLFKTLVKDFNQTIIVVTHDHDFAVQTNRIINMRDGEVISDSPTKSTISAVQ